MTNEQSIKDIKQTLVAFSQAITDKEIDKAFSVFDNDANVILSGSSKNELHRGNEGIRSFLTKFLSNPFSVSWDMSNMTIDQNENTAWVFVDGSATVTKDDGSKSSMPYRITVVMVKSGKTWKWRLFNGSVPEKD